MKKSLITNRRKCNTQPHKGKTKSTLGSGKSQKKPKEENKNYSRWSNRRKTKRVLTKH